MEQVQRGMNPEQAARGVIRVKYIEGWGLWSTLETWRQIGGKGAEKRGRIRCTSETCADLRKDWHDPPAPRRRWIPDPGDQLFYLGGEDGEYGRVEYYALRRATGEDVYLEFFREPHYWEYFRLAYEVPEWVLASLVSPTQESDEGAE